MKSCFKKTFVQGLVHLGASSVTLEVILYAKAAFNFRPSHDMTAYPVPTTQIATKASLPLSSPRCAAPLLLHLTEAFQREETRGHRAQGFACSAHRGCCGRLRASGLESSWTTPSCDCKVRPGHVITAVTDLTEGIHRVFKRSTMS